jgi:hypothetical protein
VADEASNIIIIAAVTAKTVAPDRNFDPQKMGEQDISEPPQFKRQSNTAAGRGRTV